MSNIEGLIRSVLEDNKNNKITQKMYSAAHEAGLFKYDGQFLAIKFIGTPNRVFIKTSKFGIIEIKTSVRVYQNVLDKELIVYFFDRKLEAVSNYNGELGKLVALHNSRFETF